MSGDSSLPVWLDAPLDETFRGAAGKARVLNGLVRSSARLPTEPAAAPPPPAEASTPAPPPPCLSPSLFAPVPSASRMSPTAAENPGSAAPDLHHKIPKGFSTVN